MTQFAIQSFISDARSILRDTVSERYHYTDMQILLGCVDGFRRLFAFRPESRYIDGVLTDVTFPDTENTLKVFQVSFEEKWRLGIVYYAVARCLETDVTDTVNMQLSQQYRQMADQVFAS